MSVIASADPIVAERLRKAQLVWLARGLLCLYKGAE